MKPKINYITLAVNNLGKSVAFYRDGLSWPTKGIVAQEFHDNLTGADGTIAFFELSNNLQFMLYERANLVKDAQISLQPESATEFSLGYLAESKEEVDELLKKVEAAGAKLTAPPHMRPFGVYSGYFQDPDGHLWEIAWNSNSE
jgi:predicted lactoylglutathione lyase